MHHAVTLEALRVLQAIDEKGSFALAAEALFKVPSALTYTIQKLETDLGVSLFDRRGQKSVLTPAGQLVLSDGKALLHAAQHLEEKVKQLESGWEPKLVIARDTIIPDGPILDIIGRFCGLDKMVEITLLDEALGGGWDALYSNRADIAIGLTGELPKGQYHLSTIGTIQFVFAVAREHPLAEHQGILDTALISQFPSIVVADSSRTLPGRESGLFESKQQIRVSNMGSKLEAQSLGLGIGFLPQHIAKPALDDGRLVAKAVAFPRPALPIYAAYEKRKQGKALNWFFEQIVAQNWFGLQ